MRRYSLVRNDGSIWINDRIGPLDISAASVRRSFREIDPDGPIRVSIDSPGGSVPEGLAIYLALREAGRPIHVEVHQARSIAAIIACVGTRIGVVERGEIAIHACRYDGSNEELTADTGRSAVTAVALRRMARGLLGDTATRSDGDYYALLAASCETADATILDILSRRSRRGRADIAAMLAAETVMTASEAVALGFADEVVRQ